MAEEVGVRQPDDGQAAADDARPRPPEDAAPAAVQGERSPASCHTALCQWEPLGGSAPTAAAEDNASGYL
eukprot:scaffold27150_cov60-Phaeocystis_antarctica.AAC.1